MSKISLRKKVYGFIFLVFILSAGGHFASRYFLGETSVKANSEDVETGADKKDEATPVELADVVVGEISSFLAATANLRPLRDVEVVSQSEGLVWDVRVEEGDRVRDGQLLCALDDRQLQIQLQSAKQKLAQAELQLEKSRVRREKAATQIKNNGDELQRYEKLFAEKLVSEREVAQLRYRLDELVHDEQVSSHEIRELDHRVSELKSEIAEVKLQLSQTQVRAPFSGMITERVVEKGQTVKRLDPLFKLSSFSTLFADVYLSEREAQMVEKGQKATVMLSADDSQASPGRVARISPVVDQNTGTVKITVELKNEGGPFKPGAFVRVDIETDTRTQSLLIPKRALVEQDGSFHVFVANDDVVRRAEVKLGYEAGGQAEIVEGIEVGEKVVVAGQGTLKDGSKIKTLVEESAD
jgi:RND family efflux transporter MFP subunit